MFPKSRMHFIFGIVWLFLIHLAVAERTRDKMYETIKGATCFRRLNGTHQIGCSSSFSGSVGVLHLINSTESIDFIVNDPPAPPYAPVIPPSLFTRENILRLKNDASKYVSAIVLINESEIPVNFSHELNCPNPNSGLISEQSCNAAKPETSWNPYGTGLLYEDFPFPIYYVADRDEIDKILNCFEKFNNFDLSNQKSRSLCSIQINAFMLAAANSEVCLRRTAIFNNLSPNRFCDPLHGQNIYSTLFPRDIVESNHRIVDPTEKIILISTRIDTASFFDGIGLGAMDSLISFATLINVAHLLANILPEPKNTKRNVLFMLFNGESFDFIGSQRFVYDLQKKGFPEKSTGTNLITAENIELMIDIGTLDDLENLKIYYANDFDLKTEFVKAMNEYNTGLAFDLKINETKSLNLPPTSAQSFLRNNRTFPAIIVSSAEPKNKFYHSIYDDSVNIMFRYRNTSQDFTKLDRADLESPFERNSTQIRIRNIATAIGLSVFTFLTNELYQGKEIASSILTDEFLYCFLQSANCRLFKAASPPTKLLRLPVPPLRYISVLGGAQDTARWTSQLLGFLVGEKFPMIPKENCTVLPLFWFAGINGTGECRFTKNNFSLAYSPAFSIEDYDWKSGKYSTWTESTWLQISARIFLQPSKTHEAVTLAIGLVVLILSFVVIYLMNSRSDVLFGICPSSSPIAEPAAC